jgi:hypothetical protein
VVRLIWLIDPQHGATVGRSLRVHVAGIVFEATMRAGAAGSTVVTDQVVTLSGEGRAGRGVRPAHPGAGTYTIEGTRYPPDGSEQHLGDHVVTVR